MDGDIERLAHRHVDTPLSRGMELRGPRGRTYEDDDFQSVVEAFDELAIKEPETVLGAKVYHDDIRGRLAVAMAVRGTHEELHGRADEWLRLLGANGSRVGYEWSIGH